MTLLQNQHDTLQVEVDELKKVVNDCRKECKESHTAVNRKLDEAKNLGSAQTQSSGCDQETLDTVEKLISDKFGEIEERERRKTNLIFFGIPESKSTIAECRKEEDDHKVRSLVRNSLGPSRPVGIRTMYRLGKKAGTSRPLKVVLDSESSRNEVLREFKPEKGESDKPIIVAKDRTRSERDAHNKLRSELKARSEKGEKNLVIRNGRIVQLKTVAPLNGDLNAEIAKDRDEEGGKHVEPDQPLNRSFRHSEGSGQ